MTDPITIRNTVIVSGEYDFNGVVNCIDKLLTGQDMYISLEGLTTLDVLSIMLWADERYKTKLIGNTSRCNIWSRELCLGMMKTDKDSISMGLFYPEHSRIMVSRFTTEEEDA